MKNYICKFMQEQSFPKEAVGCVCGAYEVFKEDKEFLFLLENFYNDETINVDGEKGTLFQIAERKGQSFYTAKLLFYICLSKELKKEYLKSGFDEDFWRENMADLHCKMMECFNVHGVWGIFSAGWFSSVFRMKTFTLGRMCYNTGIYDGEDIHIGGRTVTNGDEFISIHIPSNGKPFDAYTRLDSYRRAYEFFKISLFRCDSWLLYPKNKEILDKRSNIVSFMDDFKLIKSYEYPDNRIMWRIFGDKYLLPCEELPRNSSLRKAYADLLCRGERPGSGVGFFVYDLKNNETLK